MTTQNKSAPHELFTVLTYGDLEDLSRMNKFPVKQADNEYSVEDVDIFGETMTFSYLFDQNENLSELSTYSVFQADNLRAFRKKVSDFLDGFAELFDASADQYYVYSSSEVFDCKDEHSMDIVFNGKAAIEFRLCDRASSYWIVKIVNTNHDVFLCTIEHFVDNSRFNNVPVNVDLS